MLFSPSRFLRRVALATCVSLTFPAVASADILIGHPAGVTGAVAAGVQENLIGARAVFDAVNAQGGVHGQRIVLRTLDDGFKPEKTAELARQLIDEGALALFMTRGTPNTEAVLPLLKAAKVPLVGPSTGASHLHQPVNRFVFNVRSSYQAETTRVVEHIRLMGLERLAIVQVDDSFGRDAVQGALAALQRIGKAPVLHETYNRDKPDFSALVPLIVKADPQAVLFIGSSAPIAEAITQLRQAGHSAQAITLSNNASAGFIKALGPHARGVVVSQVFPWERSHRTAFIRDAQALIAKQSGVTLTQAMLEGVAAAKVLVEGLQRAGRNPTREGLRDALEGLNHFDLGGLTLSYGPQDHSGLRFVDIAIVDREGHFRR